MSALIDHLRTFIAFRSVGQDVGEKKRCLDWTWKEFLSSSGLDPVRGDVKGSPYLILRHPDPQLLWFGHVDVVPAAEEQFSLAINGDRLIGRGVKDMKGPDLTFLLAYRDACTNKTVPPVSILLTSDEEIGGRTPPILLDQDLLGSVPVAFTPDSGETPQIITELKGAIWVKLIAEGKGGHGALPWKSVNPIPKLLEVVKHLQNTFPTGTDANWQMTVTPTQLQGSAAVNQIPGEAWCTLDIRFPSIIAKTPDGILQVVRKHVPREFRLEQVEWADPMYCDPAHSMVQRIKRLAEKVTGSSVTIGRDHGSSDAREFTARGIPAFLYGPVGGDLHGAREWVSLKSLEQHVEMYRRLFGEFSA